MTGIYGFIGVNIYGLCRNFICSVGIIDACRGFIINIVYKGIDIGCHRTGTAADNYYLLIVFTIYGVQGDGIGNRCLSVVTDNSCGGTVIV